MSCVWMIHRGHSGDGCVLASSLCKYDLRKGDLFVLSWARVRRVRRGSLSSELLMCGGGVRNMFVIFLLNVMEVFSVGGVMMLLIYIRDGSLALCLMG